MDPDRIRELLQAVRGGETSVDDALSALRAWPDSDLGYAVVDHQRALRVGLPEVVFGAGKSVDQIVGILNELDAQGVTALATRVGAEAGAAVKAALPEARYEPVSRTVLLQRQPPEIRGVGPVCVVTAGTSDLPVAEEAAVTAEAFGNEVSRVSDVGVAGVHRLLHRRSTIDEAAVVIVVAGMEGALPSVVGGLTDRPVIAVPTSVGYGASFHGLSALLGMLNSCAPGVTVVNIDNGFGAAYAATRMNRVGIPR